MALEQWEKDLKRQLAGIKVPKREQWEEDLQREIDSVTPKRRVSKNTTMFTAWLVILGILTVFVYDHKTGAISQLWQRQPVSNTMPPRVSNGMGDLRDVVRKNQFDVADVKESLEKLQTKVKWNSERLALTGMLVNENAMIYRNNYDRNHLIFFNRDWTLDQMPRYLQLTDTDKEFLKKYIKPQ